MKSYKLFSVLLIGYFFLSRILFAQSVSFNVSNDSDKERLNEVIEVELDKLPGKLASMENKNVGVVNTVTNERLLTQLVDSDNNGKHDILLFQDSFDKGESKLYEIKFTGESLDVKAKAYVTFIPGREDIAWENDKVAFRMYGPPLAADVDNGIDVWSKKVDYLIIDKWYKEEEEGKSYHKDHGEGADFFSVGKSLGCGGSALMMNGELNQSGVYTNYKIIANGPLRVIFELEYVGFKVGDEIVSEKKIISLDAGSHLNKVESSYTKVVENTTFAAGLAKRINTNVSTFYDKSIISLWGDNTKNISDGLVGTAVILYSDNNKKIIEDGRHILLSSEITGANGLTYFTGACWSHSGEFESESEWNEYLNNFRDKLESPLLVEID